MNNMLLMVE